jgi:hypothetical protein
MQTTTHTLTHTRARAYAYAHAHACLSLAQNLTRSVNELETTLRAMSATQPGGETNLHLGLDLVADSVFTSLPVGNGPCAVALPADPRCPDNSAYGIPAVVVFTDGVGVSLTRAVDAATRLRNGRSSAVFIVAAADLDVEDTAAAEVYLASLTGLVSPSPRVLQTRALDPQATLAFIASSLRAEYSRCDSSCCQPTTPTTTATTTATTASPSSLPTEAPVAAPTSVPTTSTTTTTITSTDTSTSLSTHTTTTATSATTLQPTEQPSTQPTFAPSAPTASPTEGPTMCLAECVQVEQCDVVTVCSAQCPPV